MATPESQTRQPDRVKEKADQGFGELKFTPHVGLARRSECAKVSASVLNIKDEPKEFIVSQCVAAASVGVDLLHFDVLGGGGRKTSVVEAGSMDTSTQFTPALLKEIKAAVKASRKNVGFDVHIMDEAPRAHDLAAWGEAGANLITVHWEAFSDREQLRSALEVIRASGAGAGIALRPDTPLNDVLTFVRRNPSLVQLVNQNGVFPCFGGQTLSHAILDKVESLKDFRDKHNFTFQIMVDGGIEAELSGPKCSGAGADILVAGSAFFGNGSRDPLTMHSALQALREPREVQQTDLYDVLADKIIEIQRAKGGGQTWVRIEAYHGGGKTFTSNQILEKLIERGKKPVLVGLDLSWTDRSKRAKWREEAYQAKARGEDHGFFHSLKQEPEPMHWRKAHADAMIAQLSACGRGKVVVENCYQFNRVGDVNGRVPFKLAPDSIVVVEGVYASALERKDWDYKIYVDAGLESSKQRAMLRDHIKVRRAPADTRELYEDVYEGSYEAYLRQHQPRDAADVVVDHHKVDSSHLPIRPQVVESKEPLQLLQCTESDCQTQKPITRVGCCASCGGDLKNRIIGSVDFLNSIDESTQSMWRYRKLLPVDPDCIVTANEGFTPILYLSELSRTLGVNIWAKMEIANPTGTFKDREASYVISLSRQYNHDNVVMQSTGNTAMAVSHYAGLAGLESWAFIPARSDYKLIMPPRGPHAHIIGVDGHPIDVKSVAEDFAACFKYPKISPFFERCEANVTQGYEVGEALLRKELPHAELLANGGFDYYVQTLSAGMGLVGFHDGMERVSHWSGGKIKVPRVVAVEISEFSPAHTAWEKDLERVGEEVATPRFPKGDLFEPTLWTTNISRYYPHLRRMLKRSGGSLDCITPDNVREIAQRYDLLGDIEAAGYKLSGTENAPRIGFAGLARKVLSGEIPKGSNIILMMTGKGLHDNFTKQSPDCIVHPRTDKPADIWNRSNQAPPAAGVG